MNSSNGSLTVVGSGIKFLSHLSTETEAYIKQSDKVVYSLNEPAMEAWIRKNNKNSESLNFLENQHNFRIDTYKAITNYIVNEVKKSQHVCAVFYGHPTVFAKSALDAALTLDEEGYSTKILPGISSEDCLFADLKIDPGSHGCQSYEATDLLIRRKKIDPSSHAILWQIGIIGAVQGLEEHNNKIGLELLSNYLAKFYDNNHPIIIYEAALYPHLQPVIIRCHLSELKTAKLSSLSTLYITPAFQAPISAAILKKLGITKLK